MRAFAGVVVVCVCVCVGVSMGWLGEDVHHTPSVHHAPSVLAQFFTRFKGYMAWLVWTALVEGEGAAFVTPISLDPVCDCLTFPEDTLVWLGLAAPDVHYCSNLPSFRNLLAFSHRLVPRYDPTLSVRAVNLVDNIKFREVATARGP